MKLNTREINLIAQTINVPLMAFGHEKLQKVISDNDNVSIKRILNELKNDKKINSADSELLTKCLVASIQIIPDYDYHALTGYFLEEAFQLLGKMKHG